MSEQSPKPPLSLGDHAPRWLRTVGVRSWLYLGVAIWAVVVYAFLSAIAGLVVPLIIAVVIGMLFYPVVDALESRHVPRALGSILVMLMLLVVLIAALWLMVVGVVDNAGEIGQQLNNGIAALTVWVVGLNLPADLIQRLVQSALDIVPTLASGLASFFTSGFSSAIAFFWGMFMGAFLLFYLLSDWHNLSAWIGRNLGLPETLGAALVSDATAAIRSYFYALTLSSIVVSVSIALTMALLGLPLAFTIAIVTMVTSYVPYLGAIFSGAFAFLVALGSGGLSEALIVLAVVLLMQNVIQTVMQNKLASDQLQLHPLATFVSTILGATLAGLIGATLGAPVTAMLISARQRFREHRWEAE